MFALKITPATARPQVYFNIILLVGILLFLNSIAFTLIAFNDKTKAEERQTQRDFGINSNGEKISSASNRTSANGKANIKDLMYKVKEKRNVIRQPHPAFEVDLTNEYLYTDGTIKSLGFGEGGRVFKINKTLLSPDDQRDYDEGFKKYFLNVYLSDRMSLNRTIPDTRNKMCQEIKYPEDLPMVSVVLPVHNEAWSVLLRTIYSLINRAVVPHLIKEIIVVDDNSTAEHMKKPLDDLAQRIKILKIIRTDRHLSLIQARSLGMHAAKGPIVFTLDAHCELMYDWLRPVAKFLKDHPRTLVQPLMDNIDVTTFEYVGGPAVGISWVVGTITMNLDFVFANRDPQVMRANVTTPIEPIKYYGVIGTFAMMKDLFVETGGIDTGLLYWGGEQIEMALKGLLCGDGIYALPCFHVGHLTRSPKRFMTRNTYKRNKLRIAKIWFGEYAKFFIERQRPEHRVLDIGDTAEQMKMVQKCRKFGTLADTIPSSLLLIPTGERVKVRGVAINNGTLRCLTLPWGHLNSRPEGRLCDYDYSESQSLFFTNEGELRIDEGCILYIPSQNKLQRHRCGTEDIRNMKWELTKTGQIRHKESGRCLTDPRTKQNLLTLAVCDESNMAQIWRWTNFDDAVSKSRG